MTPAREYGATAREFLAKAQEELAQCELTQASEKGWGSAAQAFDFVIWIAQYSGSASVVVTETMLPRVV